MTIVVTGATGHLGRLVLESLLQRGVPAGEIVAAGRSTDKIKDFADRGVRTVAIDYSDPASLTAAFEGAQKLLLISGSELGQRIAQHTSVIEAAKAAGVELIVYTSIPRGEASSMILAEDHKGTEAALRSSGVPFTLLRNGWYFENYTAQLASFLQHGVILGSAGAGRVSGASRADFAEAAAAILTSDDDQAGAIYELGGDESFSLAELAAEISALTGVAVEYKDVPLAEYQQVLLGAGLPEPVAAMVADIDRGIAGGELVIDGGALSRLIGRPTTPLSTALKTATA